MNVSLTRQFEKFVDSLVASGRYSSSSEVVRAGLRLLQQQEAERRVRIRDLRREIDIGLKASREGRVRDGREVMAGLLTGVRRRKRAAG